MGNEWIEYYSETVKDYIVKSQENARQRKIAGLLYQSCFKKFPSSIFIKTHCSYSRATTVREILLLRSCICLPIQRDLTTGLMGHMRCLQTLAASSRSPSSPVPVASWWNRRPCSWTRKEKRCPGWADHWRPGIWLVVSSRASLKTPRAIPDCLPDWPSIWPVEGNI